MAHKHDAVYLCIYELDGVRHVLRATSMERDLDKVKALIEQIPKVKVLEVRPATLEEIHAEAGQLEQNDPNHVPIKTSGELKAASEAAQATAT